MHQIQNKKLLLIYRILEVNKVTDKSINCKEKSKKIFNKKSKNFYKTPEGIFSRTMYSTLIQRLNEKTFESLLDIGCGTGNVLALIQNKFNAQVSGIDLSEGMIEKSKEILGRNADLKIGDSENLPWIDDTFDVIICNASFHHYPNPVAVLKEMRRVLKDDGRVIIADPWMPNFIRFFVNLIFPIINNGDVKMYSGDEMSKMLANCGFTAINFKHLVYFFIVTATAKK